MKKKRTPASLPLPNFKSDEDAAAFFETHSVADVWEKLPAGRQTRLSQALEESIRERRAATKSPISIRLVPEQIAAAKKIAAAKSVGYQTQLRMWIAKGIQRELRNVRLPGGAGSRRDRQPQATK
jgi:predicted DNA binding CopG/RHH family protein